MRELIHRGLRFMIFILTTLVSGCALIPPHVEPFYFESAVFVFPTKEPKYTPMNDSQLKRYSGEFLKVSVQTKTDLAKLSEERKYNLWVEIWFCDLSESLYLWGGGVLMYQDAVVGYYSSGTTSENNRERDYVQALIAKLPTDAPKTYHFYIDTPAHLRDDHFGTHDAYDLKKLPRDICVTIGGGSMSSVSFTSNVIVVPKESYTPRLE